MEAALEAIDRLSGDKATLQLRLGEAIGAILDLSRICEAVRLESRLNKFQWERVERARAIAAKADAALAESRQTKKETV